MVHIKVFVNQLIMNKVNVRAVDAEMLKQALKIYLP